MGRRNKNRNRNRAMQDDSRELLKRLGLDPNACQIIAGDANGEEVVFSGSNVPPWAKEPRRPAA